MVASRKTAPETVERVLSTLNVDGSRRWIRPRLSKGRFLNRRRTLGWLLILTFSAVPYLRVGGKPWVLLDIPRREFVLFGTTYLPTDTLLLMLLMLSLLVTVSLLTALFGRVWCGWACPQTVYMELIFRPIERLFEGNAARQMKLDRDGPSAGRLLKFVVFLFVSMFQAHTFLAYFVGVETLFAWVQQSPTEHPGAFMIMAAVTAAVMIDFSYFREQTCIVACPYGRLQSVLLDRRSLIVGYDPQRGEPRAKRRKGIRADDKGDCIDCNACVATCPTGIDIRDGLQMECVNCTQCIDACDEIMRRVDRPEGLIRYSSRETLETGRTRFFRPRVVAYPALLIVLLGALGFAVADKQTADVTILRGVGLPFIELPSGEISNQLRVKVVNRDDAQREYLVELVDGGALKIVSPQNPLPVGLRGTATSTVFVLAPPAVFEDGSLDVVFRVTDGHGFVIEAPYRLLGPTNSRRGDQ